MGSGKLDYSLSLMHVIFPGTLDAHFRDLLRTAPVSD